MSNVLSIILTHAGVGKWLTRCVLKYSGVRKIVTIDESR